MWDQIVSVPDHCLSFYSPLVKLDTTGQLFALKIRPRNSEIEQHLLSNVS